MPRTERLKVRKQPSQARARATVEAILEAAAQVFCRHGYAAGTTDRIAERAGVSVGSVYQYFPNKDALLVALANRHIDAGFARLSEMLGKAQTTPASLDVLLRGFVEGMVALHAHEPRLHQVLFEEAPLPATLRRDVHRRQMALVSEVEAILAKHPEVEVRDVALSSYLVVQLIEGLVHGFVIRPPGEASVGEFVDEVVLMTRTYLTAAG